VHPPAAQDVTELHRSTVADDRQAFFVRSSSLALGMFCAVFVVADFVVGLAAAVASVVLLLVLVAVTWYLLPLERSRDPRIHETE
jgi:hypothetical protein